MMMGWTELSLIELEQGDRVAAAVWAENQLFYSAEPAIRLRFESRERLYNAWWDRRIRN